MNFETAPKLKMEDKNYILEEERFESSEKRRLWNEIKEKFSNLF